MASIWIQTKSAKEPSKLLGHMTMDAAIKHFKATMTRYVAEKPGRKVMGAGMDALLYDSKGRLFANLFIEPLSPPSQPGPGEKRREAA